MGYLYSDIEVGDSIMRNKCKVEAIVTTVNKLEEGISNSNNKDTARSDKILKKLDRVKNLLTGDLTKYKGRPSYNCYQLVVDYGNVIEDLIKMLDEIALENRERNEELDKRIMEYVQEELTMDSNKRWYEYRFVAYFILGGNDYEWYITNIAYNMRDRIMSDFPNVLSKSEYKKDYNEMLPCDEGLFDRNVTKPIIKILDAKLDAEYKIMKEKYTMLQMDIASSIMSEFSNRKNKRQTIKEFIKTKDMSYETFKKCREEMNNYPKYNDVIQQFNKDMQEVSSNTFAMLMGTMQNLAEDIEQGLEYGQYCLKYKKSIKDMEELFRGVKSNISADKVRTITRFIASNRGKDKLYNKKEIMNTMYKDAQGNILYTDEMKTEVFEFIHKNRLPKTVGIYNMLIRKYKETGKLEM